MKKQRNNPLGKLHKITALWLVLLMLSIAFIPYFHTHAKETECNQHSDECYGFPAGKCKICDYLLHKKGKEIFLDHPVLLAELLPRSITPGGRVYAGIYKFTLQGFANKGPPSSNVPA
uniref:hypothetical protein n=1 Tax=Pedobacter schmidteae TaxID=2201271 RepID=UPI000EB50C57|nr:hypothetical protein [Pedobacter schmidteae]